MKEPKVVYLGRTPASLFSYNEINACLSLPNCTTSRKPFLTIQRWCSARVRLYPHAPSSAHNVISTAK